MIDHTAVQLLYNQHIIKCRTVPLWRGKNQKMLPFDNFFSYGSPLHIIGDLEPYAFA